MKNNFLFWNEKKQKNISDISKGNCVSEIFITYTKSNRRSGQKDIQVDFQLKSATLNHPLNNIFGSEYDVFQVSEVKSSTVYVVVVTYDTGGTFSTTYNERRIEGIYFSSHEAEKIKNAIYNKTYKEKYGKYCFWEGYFEKLRNVEIGVLTIQEIIEQEKKTDEEMKKDFYNLIDYVSGLEETRPAAIDNLIKKYI